MIQSFAQVISELRKERGLSQRQVAEELGISQALLSHYENGLREPKFEFAVKICDYYDISADFLLGRTEMRENPAASRAASYISGGIRTSVWENDQVSSLLRHMEEIFAAVYAQKDQTLRDGILKSVELTMYKLIRRLGAVEAGQLKIPRHSLESLCDAALKLCDAELTFRSSEYAGETVVLELQPSVLEWIQRIDTILAETFRKGE